MRMGLVYVRRLGNTGANASWATHKRGTRDLTRGVVGICVHTAGISRDAYGFAWGCTRDVRGMCVGCAWDVRGMYAGSA